MSYLGLISEDQELGTPQDVSRHSKLVQMSSSGMYPNEEYVIVALCLEGDGCHDGTLLRLQQTVTRFELQRQASPAWLHTICVHLCIAITPGIAVSRRRLVCRHLVRLDGLLCGNHAAQ